ncbi:MAG: hypothetical protein ACI9O4_000458 [Chitinophagales bacterium]|jgi:hypothetical protein
MLQLFTKRQFNLGLFLIAFTFFVLHSFAAQHPPSLQVWSSSAPLAHALFELLRATFLAKPIVSFILSSFLILFQLVLVYRILSKIKNLEKHSLLVVWMYCWLIHLFPEWSSFSPVQIASTLLLFILYRVYTLENYQKNGFLFGLSTLIGFSFLLWYPAIYLIPFIAILLFQYNAISFKKISILLLSFSIPVIWFCIYYILQDQGEELLFKFSTFHLSKVSFHPIDVIQVVALGLIALPIMAGFLEAWSLSNKTIKLSRLFINSLFVLIFCLGLGFMLSINDFMYSFHGLIFPFSLFLAIFINNFKRTKHAEIAHIILLLAVLFNFVYQIIFN